MTNEEAIEILNKTAWLGSDTGIKVYPAVRMAVAALEKQSRIKKELEYLRERDPYGIMLISDVVKLLEEVEE